MKKTLQVLNELEEEGIFERYAIGGAVAAIFYTEAVATYDLDIFVVLKQDSLLVSLTPIYDALKDRGYVEESEFVMIEGVPVQFLPSFNPLTEEALENAKTTDYEGTDTRVLTAEHLLAIMLQTGRAKDRQRFQLFLDQGVEIDQDRLRDIAAKHNLSEKLDEWQS
jgi:predicted nucleotidyltransferase